MWDEVASAGVDEVSDMNGRSFELPGADVKSLKHPVRREAGGRFIFIYLHTESGLQHWNHLLWAVFFVHEQAEDMSSWVKSPGKAQNERLSSEMRDRPTGIGDMLSSD